MAETLSDGMYVIYVCTTCQPPCIFTRPPQKGEYPDPECWEGSEVFIGPPRKGAK